MKRKSTGEQTRWIENQETLNRLNSFPIHLNTGGTPQSTTETIPVPLGENSILIVSYCSSSASQYRLTSPPAGESRAPVDADQRLSKES